METARRWPLIRALAALTLTADVVFTLVCGAAQLWRGDLDPLVMPLSAYLTGPGSEYVRAVYYLMAAGLLGLAVAGFLATPSSNRSALAAVLFGSAAAALPPVAVTALFAHTANEEIARFLHHLAALITFMCLCFGMPLLSMRWRREPSVSRGTAGVVLAWAAFAWLWVYVIYHGLPSGSMQKILIVLILTWLGWAALQLLVRNGTALTIEVARHDAQELAHDLAREGGADRKPSYLEARLRNEGTPTPPH